MWTRIKGKLETRLDPSAELSSDDKSLSIREKSAHSNRHNQVAQLVFIHSRLTLLFSHAINQASTPNNNSAHERRVLKENRIKRRGPIAILGGSCLLLLPETLDTRKRVLLLANVLHISSCSLAHAGGRAQKGAVFKKRAPKKRRPIDERSDRATAPFHRLFSRRLFYNTRIYIYISIYSTIVSSIRYTCEKFRNFPIRTAQATAV